MRQILHSIAFTVVLLLAFVVLFRINPSESMRGFLLVRTFTDPERGGKVTVCLPEEIADTTAQRGYVRRRLLTGCPSGVVLFKNLAAVPGDFVELSPSRAPRVNAGPRGSTPSRRDSQDRFLAAMRMARNLNENECLILGDHVRSWDSRYFGPVPCDSLRTVRIIL